MPQRPTSNMGLVLPDLTEEINEMVLLLVNALKVVDSHNHSSGKGLKVPTSGFNFDDNLQSQNGTEKINNVQSVSFSGRDIDIPVRSMFFRGRDLFSKDSLGREVQITRNGDISNLIVNIQAGSPVSIFTGVSALQSNEPTDQNIAASKTAAENSFNNSNNRVSLNVNTLFLGGWVNISAPAPNGFYWPWIAIKDGDLSNRLEFYDAEYERITHLWEEVTGDFMVGAVAYNLYVQTLALSQGETQSFVLRSYV